MKKVLQLLVGCAISGLALYLVFRDVAVEQLKASFLEARWWPAIPFVALFFVHHILRAMRWRLLLPDPQVSRPTLRQLFDATILGNLATFLLPFRVGEFIRPLLLSRWSEYSFASCFVSVVIERFFDLSSVLLTFALIAPFLPALPDKAVGGALMLGVLSIGILLFILGGVIVPGFIRKLVDLCARPLPGKLSSLAKKFSEDLLAGAAVIHTPARLMMVILLSAGLWAAAYVQFYALLFMFPHDTSLLLSVTLGVFVALAVALPSAPGFLGVFQAGCAMAFVLFNYDVSDAQAYSLITHALTYAVYIVVGFLLLMLHGLTFSDIMKAAESREAQEEAAGG